MPNTTRKRSNYEYQVPAAQLAALLDIALKKNCDIQTVIWQAIDEFIQVEEQAWTK